MANADSFSSPRNLTVVLNFRKAQILCITSNLLAAPRLVRLPRRRNHLPNGAGAYIEDIGKLINLKDGSIRTAPDTGCVVDGIFLNEVDRVLRPGGYWILSGPPINWKKYWKGWQRKEEDLNEEQTKIEKVAKSLCWNKLVEKDDIAIWQKPKNHLDCKANHKLTQNRSFCNAQSDPDKACPVPEVSSKEETAGGAVDNWPKRLKSIPPRIYKGTIEGVSVETYSKNYELWKKRVSYYKTGNNLLGTGRHRNLLDMNAYLGGFAAALVEDPVWVMNVVPVQAKVNTPGAIYERGLIGIYHDWLAPYHSTFSHV
ncbi:hypothetical protein JHK84_029297 [Glycine max]|nr:hypothetical protein JHK84_029297 [Glycine max]